MQGRIGLMPVEMEGAAAMQVERRERVQIGIVAAAHDGALVAARHDEGEARIRAPCDGAR